MRIRKKQQNKNRKKNKNQIRKTDFSTENQPKRCFKIKNYKVQNVPFA